VRLFKVLGDVLGRYSGAPAALGGSFGYAAPSSDPEVVLGLMQDAIDSCGLTDKVAFALDCASSEVYSAESDTYLLMADRVKAEEMVSYLNHLSTIHNIVFIEDLLHQDDWDGHSYAVGQLNRSLVIGDDLVVTNQARLEKAVSLKAVGGFVLKPNQVGTISEALATYRYARENGLVAVPSGRSGGVVDDIVMDLSVGLQVMFQKNGAPRSGERIEKLNFLMRAAGFIQGCELADISPVLKF
jgi:enolase